MVAGLFSYSAQGSLQGFKEVSFNQRNIIYLSISLDCVTSFASEQDEKYKLSWIPCNGEMNT